ncbi:MAG: hypothetical protein GKR77_01645, partial [Legionellales bacterium]|nr:hypothetical protein [Legionellales bacterium]
MSIECAKLVAEYKEVAGRAQELEWMFFMTVLAHRQQDPAVHRFASFS